MSVLSTSPASVRASLASDGLPVTLEALGANLYTGKALASRFELRNWVENYADPAAVRFFRGMPNPSRVLVNDEAAALIAKYVPLKWSVLARAGFRRVNASGPAVLVTVSSTRDRSEGIRVPAGASEVIALASEVARVTPLSF